MPQATRGSRLAGYGQVTNPSRRAARRHERYTWQVTARGAVPALARPAYSPWRTDLEGNKLIVSNRKPK